MASSWSPSRRAPRGRPGTGAPTPSAPHADALRFDADNERDVRSHVRRDGEVGKPDALQPAGVLRGRVGVPLRGVEQHVQREDVSQVLMCYSPRESLQPTTLNVIEWPHDSPGLALSSLSRDRYRTPWPDPARQATVPVPRTTLRGAYVPVGV